MSEQNYPIIKEGRVVAEYLILPKGCVIVRPHDTVEGWEMAMVEALDEIETEREERIAWELEQLNRRDKK